MLKLNAGSMPFANLPARREVPAHKSLNFSSSRKKTGDVVKRVPYTCFCAREKIFRMHGQGLGSQKSRRNKWLDESGSET